MNIRVEQHFVIFTKLPGYSIFYHEKRIPTFCCLMFDHHRQLRIPVTTFNQYLRGAACDSLPGVLQTLLEFYPRGASSTLKNWSSLRTEEKMKMEESLPLKAYLVTIAAGSADYLHEESHYCVM